MERLTRKTIGFGTLGEYLVKNPTMERCAEAITKLGKYEDAEENGLLVRLPCKVGDTVWVKMQFGGYAEAEVRDSIHILFRVDFVL